MIRIHFPSSTAEFLQHHTAFLHRRQNATPDELAIDYHNIKEWLLNVTSTTVICTRSSF